MFKRCLGVREGWRAGGGPVRDPSPAVLFPLAAVFCSSWVLCRVVSGTLRYRTLATCSSWPCRTPSMGPQAMTWPAWILKGGGPGAPPCLASSTCSVSWVRPLVQDLLSLWLRLPAKAQHYRCSVTVQSVGAVGLRWSEHRLCYTHQVQRSSSQTPGGTAAPQLCLMPSFLPSTHVPRTAWLPRGSYPSPHPPEPAPTDQSAELWACRATAQGRLA